MKLKNNSSRDYNYDMIFLKAGEELEVVDEKACKVLLNQDGVEEVLDREEIEKLKAEVEKLKAKPQNKKAKK